MSLFHGYDNPTQIHNVRFIINPSDRKHTSASLVSGQDLLMEKSFPRKNYFIMLAIHTPKNESEWEFVKNTMITFEGMIKKKFRADKVSKQEAPQIELHFPSNATEDPLKYHDRIKILESLLREYHEGKGGLSYCLWNETLPNIWAIDFVVWGIIYKDNFRMEENDDDEVLILASRPKPVAN